MLSLDPVTRSAYDAAGTAADKAQVVLAALTAPVYVRVYNDADVLMGGGQMESTWATRSANVLTMGELVSFEVSQTGTPAAGWYLRFESGTRWLRGTFGPGGDFTWSLSTWEVGQLGVIGTATVTASTAGQVTATLSASYALSGATIAFGWTIADVPWPIGTFTEGVGGTYDLSQHAYTAGATPQYTVVTGPADVTVNQTTGLLTIPASLPASADSYAVTVDLVDASATEITTLSVSSAGAWTFGQVFAKGDAPDYVAIDGGQADIRNRWSDGSVKFSVLSKISSGAETVSIKTASSPSTGTVAMPSIQASVTFTNVQDYLGTVLTASQVVNIPIGQTATWGTIPTAGLVRSITNKGSVMSEYHYFAPVPNSKGLAVWWYVRAYSNGATEVETVVTNGWMYGDGSGTTQIGSRHYDWEIRVGNTVRGSGVQRGAVPDTTSRGHQHHTQWSRVDWIGTDPQITPSHNRAYLQATKVVPTYLVPYNPDPVPYTYMGYVPLGQNTYELQNRPVPFTRGDYERDMGTGGTAPETGIIPGQHAKYLIGADAYNSIIANARGCGRYPLHYRNENTGEPANPAVQSVAYTKTVSSFSGWKDSSSSTDSNTTLLPTPTDLTLTTDANDATLDLYGSGRIAVTHMPTMYFLPYLLSGRWQFMEGCQQIAWAENMSLAPSSQVSANNHHPFNGVNYRMFRSEAAVEVRGTGHQFKDLAYAVCATPDNHASRTGYKNLLSAHVDYYHRRVIGATAYGPQHTLAGDWVTGNVISMPPNNNAYASSSNPTWAVYGNFQVSGRWAAFLGCAATIVDDLTNQTDLTNLAKWALKWPVGLLGTNATFNWRRYASNDIAYGQPKAAPPTTWASGFDGLYTYFKTYLGLSDISDTEGLALLRDGNTEVQVYESCFYDSVCAQFGCLHYAVEFGVTGAAAAYKRLYTSSTYLRDQAYFGQLPTWGMVHPNHASLIA